MTTRVEDCPSSSLRVSIGAREISVYEASRMCDRAGHIVSQLSSVTCLFRQLNAFDASTMIIASVSSSAPLRERLPHRQHPDQHRAGCYQMNSL